MNKKIAILALALTAAVAGGTGIFIASAETVTSEEIPNAQTELGFDFYTSGLDSFASGNDILVSGTNGEQKAMVKNFSSRTLDVSFTLTPTSAVGQINGGLYLFASGASSAQDGIDALNVQIERTPESSYYKVQIFDFKDGTFAGSVSNTIPLAYKADKIDVRVIVDSTAINVYLDGSDIPSITKKIAATSHAGTQIGFRGQHVSQIFSNISISDRAVAPENKTVKVLMVGNSYAQDTMTYAHEIAKADGVNMVCGVLYYGGCTVRQHVDFIKNSKAVYTYFKNGGTDRAKVDFFDVLYDEDWDYITIQTGKGEQGMKDTFYPYLPWLIALIENRLPHVEIGLFESWAVPQCYEGTGNSRLSHYDDNSEKMYQSVIRTFSDLKKENGVQFVVPSAEAFHRMNETDVCDNSVFETSFFRDSTAHANEKGRYMLGLTMYRAITGRQVTGNRYAPVGLTYGEVAGPEENVRKAIQAIVDGLFEDYNSTNAMPNAVTLDYIEVRNAKTQYRVGNYFDYASLQVYAHYSDGNTVEVTTWAGNIFRRLTAEDEQVVITYRDKSATVSITVA